MRKGVMKPLRIAKMDSRKSQRSCLRALVGHGRGSSGYEDADDDAAALGGGGGRGRGERAESTGEGLTVGARLPPGLLPPRSLVCHRHPHRSRLRQQALCRRHYGRQGRRCRRRR